MTDECGNLSANQEHACTLLDGHPGDHMDQLDVVSWKEES